MVKKLKIILDCDDVLLRCNSIAVSLLNKEFGTNYQIDDIDRWGVMDSMLDRRLRYFYDPEFVASQTPYPDACAFVARLTQNAEVCIATSVPDICRQAREKSIRLFFPNVHHVYIGNDKSSLKADYMLDDNIYHLESANVKHPIMYSQPWNRKENRFQSVNSYCDFMQLLKV